MDLKRVFQNISRTSCPYDMNFHCHTKYSDGSLDPIDLYIQANTLGLSHIAVTDHHSIQAYLDIYGFLKINNNKIYKTKLWSGVEITSLLNNCLVHILAFDFDVESKYLSPYLLNNSVKGDLLEASNVIKNIKKANGLSFLAHPARYRIPYTNLINEAAILGIDGVEVWYDYDRKSEWKVSTFVCESIEKIVNKNNLLISCGTDTHGISLLKR